MGIAYPSEEWIQEWKRRLNDNDDYGEVGEGWGVGFDGSFVFHLRADNRLPEDAFFYIDLEDGECLEARRIESEDAVDAGFVYRGDYADWVRLQEGELGAIDGMMSGVFELEGDMQKVLQFSDAAIAMTENAGRIETDYRY